MREKYSVSQYIRNPGIKREVFLYLAVLGVGMSGSVCFLHAFFEMEDGERNAALSAVAAMWAVLFILHFASSFCRYRKLAELSDEIDRVLHREETTLLERLKEGELSILESEINKMLIRLKEQNGQLKRQKTYLADSLADLSHQLRTPLTSMNLIFPMLEEEGITEEKRDEYLWKLQSLLQKVQWMIDVLLKISKLDADAVRFQMQNCPLAALIREACAVIEIPMELKGQRLFIEMDGEAAFWGDYKWTQEAVINIVKNCMEHTGEGGAIRILGRENALFTELVIEDNGPGIAKEDLPHIFERFYKGKNSSETSVGIGLALAGMIVKKEAGMISAENRKEGGARFCIRFYKDTV